MKGLNRDLNPGPLAPKARIIPLDHWALCDWCQTGCSMYQGKLGVFRVQSTLTCQKACGSGGIRTHAPEETGALNQRLRPLGHATLIKDACLSQFSICVQPIYSAAMFLYGWATFLKRDQLQWWEKTGLSGVGFEPTPSYEDQNSHRSLSRNQGSALSLAP